MTSLPRRFIKLGGSLLDWAPWPTHFEAWLATQPAAQNVVLAGGGRLADAVREIDALHPLPPVAAHWLCIRMMSIQAGHISHLWPKAHLCVKLPVPDACASAADLVVVDPWIILREDEPHCPGDALAAGWHVTSDSIAARLAAMVDADELVLLKSASAQEGETAADLAARGYIDAFFPRVARGLRRVWCVNLRDPGFPSTGLS